MNRARTLWFVSVTLFDEIAVVLIMLFVLPLFGIDVPLIVVASVLAVFSALAFLVYRALAPVVSKKPEIGQEALIGMMGSVESPLVPEGLVELAGELWRAKSLDGNIERGEKVLVVDVKGLKLVVSKRK